MSRSVAPDLCRVVLVAPRRTVELALPQGVPLADLLPVLVQRVSLPSSRGRSNRHGRGRPLTGQGDWVLQRLGGSPLEEDLTPAALHIRDGETLYLRPRQAQLPPAHFDDLIDGIATGLRQRADRWRDWMTRPLFLIICALILGVCFAVLLDDGFPGREQVAGGVALILVFTAMLCSRALDDGWAALTLSIAALAFAALAGYLVPLQLPGDERLAANTLYAMAAASLFTLLAGVVVGVYRPVFLGIWLATTAGTLGALLAVFGLSGAQAAGAVMTLVLVASIFAPGISFRLARMRLPQLPTGGADLADDIEPYPAAQLMAGAAAADTYLTWISLAVGTVCTVGTVILSQDGRWPALALIAAVGLVLMIRSRGMTSCWQRGAALTPATLGPAVLAVYVINHSDPLMRLAATAVLLALAGVTLACARTLPGRRLLPYWGRLVDIFEYVFALAMIVLLFRLFDAFQWARALAG